MHTEFEMVLINMTWLIIVEISLPSKACVYNVYRQVYFMVDLEKIVFRYNSALTDINFDRIKNRFEPGFLKPSS